MSDNEDEYQLPPVGIWNHISKIAITEDKPIMLDYWIDSLEKKILIGIKDNGEAIGINKKQLYKKHVLSCKLRH